jgi:hypothetical protein
MLKKKGKNAAWFQAAFLLAGAMKKFNQPQTDNFPPKEENTLQDMAEVLESEAARRTNEGTAKKSRCPRRNPDTARRKDRGRPGVTVKRVVDT